MKRRQGTGLAELAVALALAGVVTAVAVAGLAQHQRLQQRQENSARAEQVAHDVLRVLRAQLRHAIGVPRLLGDTAIQLSLLRGALRACAVAPSRLVLPVGQDWWTSPRVGDSLAALDTLTGIEWRAAVLAVGTQRASADCPTGGMRLTLSAPAPETVPVMLLPVRIFHTVRLAPYRASDGSWWFGERLCQPACGAMQPIAGPLRSPADGGFRLQYADGDTAGSMRIDVGVLPAVAGQGARATARLTSGGAP